ncbi:MAG: hypothetical protein JSR27_07655 [Proteobacteria bacterium]|nr:hypothetical protein [Pseudomonadota bacterium]
MTTINRFFGFLLACIALAATSVRAQNIAGTYTGTYTGAESGMVTITIASDNRTVKCDFSGNVFYGFASIYPSPLNQFAFSCSGTSSPNNFWLAETLTAASIGAPSFQGIWQHSIPGPQGTVHQGTFVTNLTSGGGGSGSIDASYTGSWYDPSQSGQGFNIEVLGNQVLAYWYVFDDAGYPAWILGVGPINGNTATMTAFRSVGGKFPPLFNAANVTQQPWGTLTFSFSNCKAGQMSWTTNVSGFGTGSGSMLLTRLTVPSGINCQ